MPKLRILKQVFNDTTPHFCTLELRDDVPLLSRPSVEVALDNLAEVYLRTSKACVGDAIIAVALAMRAPLGKVANAVRKRGIGLDFGAKTVTQCPPTGRVCTPWLGTSTECPYNLTVYYVGRDVGEREPLSDEECEQLDLCGVWMPHKRIAHMFDMLGDDYSMPVDPHRAHATRLALDVLEYPVARLKVVRVSARNIADGHKVSFDIISATEERILYSIVSKATGRTNPQFAAQLICCDGTRLYRIVERQAARISP
jgi:hypothetical protein